MAEGGLPATLVAELPDAVSLHDAEGTYLYASPAFVHLSGWEPEQLVGRDAYLLYHPNDIADLQAAHVGLFEATGRPVSAQYRLRCFDGSYRWVESTARVTRDGHIAVITRSIADRRSLLHALDNERLVADRLRELDRERQAFLTAITHQSRHPMTAVVGFAKLLQSGRIAPDKQQQIFDRLVANAERASELIEVSTTADELGRRACELRPKPVDLAGLTRDLAADFWDLDHPEDTIVTLKLPTHALVFADRERLTLALRALFHNAVKHTPVGTRIWVRVETEPGTRLLVVEDDGPGVPDLVKTAIFDRLAHGDHDQKHPDPGLGLGLYLVDQIARAHAGRAWVEDREGGGASFRLLLPSANPA